MATTYIALERMKVGDGLRESGDPVPEAADWPWQTREHYIRNGRLIEMDAESGAIVSGGDRHRQTPSTAPQVAAAAKIAANRAAK